MGVGGWFEAWAGLVSLGWVLVVLAVGSFAVGVIWSSWWKDRHERREARDALGEHHRQHVARRRREQERMARDARLLQDVEWQWVDVLADLRRTSSDGTWLDLRGTRPVRAEDGVRLVVAMDPERMTSPASRILPLRASRLGHAVMKVTGRQLDIELVPDASAARG